MRVLRAIVLLGACAALPLTGCRKRGGPTYAEARAVVDRHCVPCHSENNTVPAFPIAAANLVLDTADQLVMYAGQVHERTVIKRDMPLLNKTGMSDEERAVIQRWFEAGAAGP
jgi:uncharacterized membrane protein